MSKQLKAIIFGVLVLLAFASGTWILMCMCAVEIHDFWAFVKYLLISAAVFSGSSLAIKYLWKAWYEK